MMMKPQIDVKGFRLSKLNQKQYRHLWLLAFWPLFGVFFKVIEDAFAGPYHPVHCALDDAIPFCEWFLLPYLFWFVFLAGSLAFAAIYAPNTFRRTMAFIMLTYIVTGIVYLVYPTCQQLRPLEFPRDNLLTRLTEWIYTIDTNTNVCPSIHVIGSFAALFALLDSGVFHKRPVWQIACWLIVILICASTVFLKQHSALDAVFALPLCAVGYLLCFVHRKEISKKRNN